MMKNLFIALSDRHLARPGRPYTALRIVRVQ